MQKIAKPLFLIGSLILFIGIYWPVLHGEPIWDDTLFWFLDPLLTSHVTYQMIWTQYAWPLTASLQKLTFFFWGYQYEKYHALNMFLHMLNSLLVFQVARRLAWPHPKWIFLLFLFHPANVISVAWMIQLKTLFCFTLSILALISFLNGLSKRKWIPLAWILFFLAVNTKSAALPLSMVFLLLARGRLKKMQALWLVPFFIISIWGTHKLVTSEVTQQTVALISESNFPAIEEPVLETPKAAAVETSGEEVPKEAPTLQTPPAPAIESPIEEIPQAAEPAEPVEREGQWSTDPILVVKTLRYYFWQAILPWDVHPIKGQHDQHINVWDLLHLAFLSLLLFIFRKDKLIWYLAAAYLILVPFLGIIPAPFMNITWVSDQHLYLAIPAFLVVWFMIFKKLIPRAYVIVFPMLLLPFYFHRSHQAVSYYKNDLTFFSASLRGNNISVPVVYNLATIWILRGNPGKAKQLVEAMMKDSEKYPEMKKDKYFPLILELHDELNSTGNN